MPASYPSVIKTFTDKVDNVDTVMAADINSGYDEIEALENALGVNLAAFTNDCYNSQFRVAQRGTSFTAATTPANSDGNYLFDGWVLLSDGNDIVDVTQSGNACKLEVETANKQFGKLYIVDSKESLKYIGGALSVQFKAKMNAVDDNTHSLKCVVLSWSSTADTVTRDVVGTWGATITPAANWTDENVAASNTLTTDYQTFEIENVSVDTASTANVAVFIYCDQTNGAVDDAVYITDVQINPGAVCATFVQRSYQSELIKCQWNFIRESRSVSGAAYGTGGALSTTAAIIIIHHPKMRTNAACSTSATAGDFTLRGGAATVAVSSFGAPATESDTVQSLLVNVASGLTAGDSYYLRNTSTNVTYIDFSCEL